MTTHRRWALVVAAVSAAPAVAVGQQDVVVPITVAVGQSVPITLTQPLTKVSVANPDVADVVVISTTEVVINARAPGESDAIVWLQDGGRMHYRMAVRSTTQHRQIVISLEFAEVDRTLSRDLGLSGLYTDQHNQVGTGAFAGGAGSAGTTPAIPTNDFLTVLTDFDTQHLLGLLQAQEQRGRARSLAEPRIMASDREPADFLAGGEVPVPVVQTGGTAGPSGAAPITIQYKEYGVRLHFVAEILNDTLVRITLRPEVSALDFTNAIVLSGFRIPALTTRRVESTVDVRRGQSLVLSGMFNDVWQRTRTGIPLLQHIPILGLLFSSTQWQHNQTELLIVVTPVVVDPVRPDARDLLPLVPDTTLPAREAIRPRLPELPASSIRPVPH